MELVLLAVGRLRPSYREACDDYLRRLRRSLKVREVEVREASRAPGVAAQRTQEGERLLARRVLLRLRRPTTHSLVLANKILDYLDLNADSLLSEKEVALCVEIFERCSALAASNGTLSERELKRVYSILRRLDADDDHALNASERAALRQALEDPAKFFERYHEESQVLHRSQLAAG